ncbi:MAG: dihydrofolate synthase/folylpolyglutamate synthase, partial [Candidatus Azotimanducaceae bacterium]
GRKLDLLKPAAKVFIVAGTNGKGSTCEYLARYCQALNLSYGKATSPFLSVYNEQIVVNGQLASDDTISAAFAEIDQARGTISLSYFEFGALAAMLIFKQSKVDVAILEVGLGGRLDAMNIVYPDVSVITRIALDHQNWLGDSREAIAVEKAGVMRRNVPVVIVDPEPPESLINEANRQGAIAKVIQRDFQVVDDELAVEGQTFQLPQTRLPLPSAVAATVAFLAVAYPLDQKTVSHVLESSQLPGRFQKIPGSPALILDVAHNPDAAGYLLNKLALEGYGNLQAVVGLYKDKDIAGVFQHLSPMIRDWHFVDLPGERAASAEHLQAVLSDSCGLSGKTYDKVGHAIEAAKRRSDPEGTVLVFGSFLTVAAVLEYLDS